MNRWLEEFKRSWHDKNFVCSIAAFALGYGALLAMGLLLSDKLFLAVVCGIAGWQLAAWASSLGPKLAELLQRLKILR
jgi:hypothetical protein